jgi:hypothetical protein
MFLRVGEDEVMEEFTLIGSLHSGDGSSTLLTICVMFRWECTDGRFDQL